MANNNDYGIKVDFPSKMKIESPELDAVKKSTETISNILTKHIQEIIKPLQVLFDLPELIKNLRETITENFNNLFTSNIESDVLNRQAIIKVTESKTGFIKTYIEKKQRLASEAVEVIKKDYEGYFDELANDQKNFLNQIDSHAYEILEKVYPNQVQEKFSYQSIPCLNFLSDHISSSAFSRSFCINEALSNTEREISKFIDERNLLYSELDNYCINNIGVGYYEMPLWFVEVENTETNEIDLKVFTNSNDENELNDETLLLIKDALECRLSNSKDKNNSILDITCDILTKSLHISNNQIERLREECKLTIMEE